MATAGLLDEKLQFSIVLALTAASAGQDLLSQQDELGRQLGMTRAEIQAARQGFSFDHRSAKALAFALALVSGTGSSQRQRSEASRAGIDAQTCTCIEQLAAELSPPLSFGRKKNAP